MKKKLVATGTHIEKILLWELTVGGQTKVIPWTLHLDSCEIACTGKVRKSIALMSDRTPYIAMDMRACNVIHRSCGPAMCIPSGRHSRTTSRSALTPA